MSSFPHFLSSCRGVIAAGVVVQMLVLALARAGNAGHRVCLSAVSGASTVIDYFRRNLSPAPKAPGGVNPLSLTRIPFLPVTAPPPRCTAAGNPAWPVYQPARKPTAPLLFHPCGLCGNRTDHPSQSTAATRFQIHLSSASPDNTNKTKEVT
jgi:hypothetical protein